MATIDNKFEQLLNNDNLHFEADPTIQERLNYQFQLKAAKTQTKQSSILPLFMTLLGSKLLGWKLSFATIALFMFFNYNQMINNPILYSAADTAYVENGADSLYFLSVDSLFSSD